MSAIQRRVLPYWGLVFFAAAVHGQAAHGGPSELDWLRPPALKPGDTIAFVAPAGLARRPAIDAYAAYLRNAGYQVLIPNGIENRKSAYLAGTDQERADELNAMIRDPKVRAIFPVAGGFGLTRIIDKIDYPALRKDPKIITGYSDLTALHLSIARKAKVISFHSPMVQSSLSQADKPEFAFQNRSFTRTLFADHYKAGEQGFPVLAPGDPRPTKLVGGKARGRLIGGNLTLISSTMGTPFEIEPKGIILFIEDVNEAPYRVDRYLSQLRLAGILDAVTGIVVGSFTTKDPVEASEIDRVLHEYLSPLKVPSILNFPVGHTPLNATLPIGGLVELDADTQTLRLLENPVKLSPASPSTTHSSSTDWPRVGNDGGAMRYSSLDQINRANVKRLVPLWTYHTGELVNRPGKTIECTPIVIDGVMYITTAYLRVVALDAATGKEIWQFDPLKDHPFKHSPASGGVNRGCAYWSDGKPAGARRIIHGTSDGRLFSLDAHTGKLDPQFGDGGIRNLRTELDPKVHPRSYGPTSAPAIWNDTIILGVSCDEGPGLSAPGDIRAFDVRTGKQLWRFHTVPQPGEPGYETWAGESWKDRGGANAWGGISVDIRRGIVFAGLGSAAFDFFGGDRLGDNLFANCTIALDARTGKRLWHFQTLRHDLWDHDIPVYPNLVTVTHNGKPLDAVAQVTKTGYVFLFDRETGKPLFDIKDQPVPPSDVPGERAAATQPVPVKPPPFSVQFLDETNITNIGEANRASVLAQLKKIRSGPAFNPPSLVGTVVVPGFHGGANWSGASFDPTTGLLYVNSNNVPNIITLKPATATRQPTHGPYGITGYIPFLDHEGYSAMKPPWGVLTAINLNIGDFAWQVPLGEHVELTARGVPRTGTETFGGSIVTAGGLVFIAGTKDERIHAFDKQTGDLLWEHPLPAGGYATPATYKVKDRQYVVIAAGGSGKLRTKPGDAFVAFGLPGAN